MNTLASSTSQRLRRRSRLVLVGLVAALAIGVPAAWATFDDVSAANPFYADVNAIQDAGITQGCGGGNFCPTDPIQRQAEAAFVHRGLGRVAGSQSSTSLQLTSSYQDLAVASITTGGVPGESGFVIATGDFSAFASVGSALGDRVEFDLAQDSGSGDAADDSITLYPTTAVLPSATGSMTWATAAPTGTTRTFRLRAKVVYGDDTITVKARHITLLYVPFGSIRTFVWRVVPPAEQ